MSKLREIKNQQLKAAKSGRQPEESAAVSLPKRVGKLAAIKAKQLKENPDLYGQAATPSSTKTDLSGLFEQLQAAMETDIARIKTHKNLADKTACKAELLQGYRAFVEDYIKQGHDYPNSVAVQLMIWLFDVNDIEPALSLGLYLVKTDNQHMPKQFNRDLQTFICDAIYDWAKEQLKNDHSSSPYLDRLVETVEADKWDLSPPVKSKLLVMLAKHKNRIGEFNEVVALCDAAIEANPEGAGVKKLRELAAAKL